MSLFPESCSFDTYHPRRPALFRPTRIILARGSDRPEYSGRIAGICALYPDAEVVVARDVPHNRIDLGTHGLTEAHYGGKHTLVLAVHQSPVRLSSEEDNTCPNYWHFSPYGFCPYDCSYCYLAGTPGVRFSPTVKVYLNIKDVIDSIDRTARRLATPTAFYCGKLQDGLALDPLTGYSRLLIPFFAAHPYARMTLLTKSTEVNNLMDLEHRGHTTLSWSLNPPEVAKRFELNTPSMEDRLAAMRRIADAGYPVRAVVMPIVPVEKWESLYAGFLEQLLTTVRLHRLTLGGICSYSAAKALMEHKLGPANEISRAMIRSNQHRDDGRIRYPEDLRVRMYGSLISIVRKHAPHLNIGLCLEERRIFAALNLESRIGNCNCVL